MEHPQVLEQVEIDAAISHVLPEVVFQQQAKTKWFSSWLQPAVAFCLGLIIGLPIMYTLLSDNASTVGGAANIVYVERFRSGDQQQRTVKVDVTQNSNTLVIVIAPVHSGAASYTLTLVKNGEIFSKIKGLMPDEMGDITMALPSKYLNELPIEFKLSGEGESASETIVLEAMEP